METNKNVESIIGDPKKAINKLSGPLIASMLLIMANNIIDSIWVAGLGADPLAALGFVTPLFTVLIGVGNGVGAGANSLISRYIGAKDVENANNATVHSAILSVIVSIVLTAIMIYFLKDLLLIMGASSVLAYGMEYGVIIFSWTFAILIPPILGGIFRAEGDIKKATLPLIITAISNMILDPIFIYGLNLGVGGAAWATGIASFIGLLMMIYWIFINKSTYLKYDFKNFKNKFSMYKDILIVGIPASLEQLIMSVLGVVVNLLITIVAGTTEIAVFTAGWRVIQIGIMPAVGIGTAAITVAGVAYGSRKFENLKIGCRYSVKLGFIISLIFAFCFYLFADQIALLFSYSSSSAHLAPLIAKFMKLMCLFILFVPFGATAGNIFQGLGKGPTSLALTTLRELVLVLIFAYLIGITFNGGEYGIYTGMLLGGLIGSLIAYSYVEIYIKRLEANNGR